MEVKKCDLCGIPINSQYEVVLGEKEQHTAINLCGGCFVSIKRHIIGMQYAFNGEYSELTVGDVKIKTNE